MAARRKRHEASRLVTATKPPSHLHRPLGCVRKRTYACTQAATQSPARYLARLRRPYNADDGDWMMTARKELEQKAHQLTELINATHDALDSKELNDSGREGLRKQIGLRVAARKEVLKWLWVTPHMDVFSQP